MRVKMLKFSDSLDTTFAPTRYGDFKLKDGSFRSVTQYYLSRKALYFRKPELAAKILNARSPHKSLSVAEEAGLMRISDEPTFLNAGKTWGDESAKVMYAGNLAKFQQNPYMAHHLKRTGDAALVYCKPEDTYFGIGLNATDPDWVARNKWKGKNVLGEILVRVRERLVAEDEEKRKKREAEEEEERTKNAAKKPSTDINVYIHRMVVNSLKRIREEEAAAAEEEETAAKRRAISLEEKLKKSKSFITTIVNDDLSLPRAVVVAKAHRERFADSEKAKRWASLGSGLPSNLQKKLAIELMKRAGLEDHEGACGLKELEKIQTFLEESDGLQIKVLGSQSLLWKGPIDSENIIHLFYVDADESSDGEGHYVVCTRPQLFTSGRWIWRKK